MGCWVENLYGFAPNALAWVDPLGLYGYYELYKNGKLVYRGITERKAIDRIMEHAADCKDFDDARYIEDLKTIELREIWKVRDCGMIGILMKIELCTIRNA